MTAAAPVVNHRIDGRDDAPPIILGSSIGTAGVAGELWAALVPALARTHRVIRFDLPGHGGTPVSVLPTAETPDATTMADLAELVLALADHLGLDRFHYAGDSIGGAIGQQLAITHPERLLSLTAICTSSHFGDPANWSARSATVRKDGLGAVADAQLPRWFPESFHSDPRAQSLLADLRTAVDPIGYAACCDALGNFDSRPELPKVTTVPTLAVAGRQDLATPPEHLRELADLVPDAALTEIPRAGHLAPVDAPEAVTAALLAHLAAVGDAPARPASDDSARYAAGIRVRRQVLGDAHVDRATSRITELTAEFQDFITRYAWGEIWTRPGLDRRTRSCITITALIAHGHLDELGMHIRAAINNGLTREEIKEVVLQSAIYCGVPSANSAFGVAQRVLAEIDAEN
ncbi:bifunctional 3-oxoadipate enol-lactonase/4-carboxymuconolactone decarboxylase PcaDC [Phaeacidiphilus oryzae]|uniref:bifunctional 3-oxoadipate enol-lactonase/4-carboxymuconolactone decarboxylase PcaDC n=1 Tax=Phaeacidiphilus oryzae TaxID=348818 RepID=UPI000565AC90|nr:4-carboxymuconolactone decarboxylase [Phaeacidiphilus oryzae]